MKVYVVFNICNGSGRAMIAFTSKKSALLETDSRNTRFQKNYESFDKWVSDTASPEAICMTARLFIDSYTDTMPNGREICFNAIDALLE